MIDRFQDGKSEALLTQGVVGVRLSDITSERLTDIIKIYDKTVGGGTLPEPRERYARWTPDFLPELLSDIDGGRHEFYFGSIINRDSKLLIVAREPIDDGESIVTFTFDANILNPSDKQRAQAQRLSKEFKRCVNEYLIANDIGILLSTESPVVAETESSTTQLGDALLDTAYLNNRIYRGPDRIDLGEFNGWIEALMTWSNEHPERHEAGGLIYTSFLQGIVEASDLIPGSKNRVSIPLQKSFIDYQMSKINIFFSAIGANAHSHPDGFPFTPRDFVGILLGNNDPTAVTAVILIAPRDKYIAFRGERTPAMSRGEAEIEADRRTAYLLERVDSWPDAKSSEIQRYIASIVEYATFFHQMCQDWDLQVFRCNRDEQVLSRLTNEQMGTEAQELLRQATRVKSETPL
ncbi:MAG: hypothetical protein HYT09_03470 [Candidatus Levybacteria bacterium]|nr:hypothetical protein [Candidatus Levybacteria bacterium]